jgi:hypothetical protein
MSFSFMGVGDLHFFVCFWGSGWPWSFFGLVWLVSGAVWVWMWVCTSAGWHLVTLGTAIYTATAAALDLVCTAAAPRGEAARVCLCPLFLALGA